MTRVDAICEMAEAGWAISKQNTRELVDEVRRLRAALEASERGPKSEQIAPPPAKVLPLVHCAADKDGECRHKDCPQIRDDEPKRSGRHCPIDTRPDDDY